MGRVAVVGTRLYRNKVTYVFRVVVEQEASGTAHFDYLSGCGGYKLGVARGKDGTWVSKCVTAKPALDYGHLAYRLTQLSGLRRYLR